MSNLVGINESQYTPQHPEQRLANLAKRGRKWNNRRMGLTTGAGDFYRLGTYTLTWDGFSDVRLNGELIENQPNFRVYKIDSHNPAGLVLSYTGDQPTNVRLTCNEVETIGPFTKQFIDDVKRFDIWRTMDLTKTNGSAQSYWENRPQLSDDTWFDKGWPWELVIEAANLSETDLWICIPHLATERYIVKLAELIHSTLDPNRTVYVEYSNECWNGNPAFTQTEWIIENLANGNRQERDYHYGYKAGNVYSLFKGSFSLKQNIPKFKMVLAGQAVSINVIKEALIGFKDYNPNSNPDILSCAAYFNPGQEGFYEEYLKNPEDLDGIAPFIHKSLETRTEWWQRYSDLAKELNIPLIAYEGGQHISAKFGEELKNKDYVEFLHRVNNHPLIFDSYELLRDIWETVGGQGLVYFNRLYSPTEFGSWGHQEYVGHNSYKNQALNEHLQEAQMPDNNDNNIILDFPTGGLGNATDWAGNLTSKYTKETAITLELDEPITGPLTIEAQVARIGIRNGFANNGDKNFGMASVVRLWSTEHGGFMTLDHCEPTKPAGRTRAVEFAVDENGKKIRGDDGKLIIYGLQNGSSPANDRDNIIHLLTNNERGRYHYIYGVFNPDDYRPELSDVDNLWCYVDDNGRSIQAPDRDPKMSREFNRITIGLGDPGIDHCVLYINHLKITNKIGTKEDSIINARKLNLTADGGDWYDENTWPKDNRYAYADNVNPPVEPPVEPPVDPPIEPPIIEILENGTYEITKIDGKKVIVIREQ